MASTGPVHPHGFLVWRLSMRWRVAVDRALAPLEVTHAQYVVLATLSATAAEGVNPSQRMLADRTGLEPLYISKLARTLDSAGLIVRDPDPDDTRAVRLHLSAEGTRLIERAVLVVEHLIDDLLTPLGGPDSARARQFRHDLDTLLDAPPHLSPAPGTRGRTDEGARS